MPLYNLLRSDFKSHPDCRYCKHFVRVRQLGNDVPHGFCLVGQLQGDYSLYCSTSASSDCGAFSFDQESFDLWLLEKDLESKWMDIKFGSGKKGKRVDKEADDMILLLKGRIDFKTFLEKEAIKRAAFVAGNKKKYIELANRCLINNEEYALIRQEVQQYFQKRISDLLMVAQEREFKRKL